MTVHKITISVHSRWIKGLAKLAATGLAVAVIGAAAWFLLLRAGVLQAQNAMNCAGQYLVDVTLPAGSRWEMCWEQRDNEGIIFYDIHFTPAVSGVRRKVLAQANLAQIHVPYDDNGARFHDLSDFGLGGINMNNLTQADCPNGTLLVNAGKNVLCMQIEPRGYAYKYFEQQLQGYQLSLFSVSHIGQYNYIPVWRFVDNGAVEPTVGATGRLQRLEYNRPNYGWVVRSDGGGNVYAISHMHNYYWRLDFDVDGPQNDMVEEFEFTPTNNNWNYQIAVTPLTTEAARTVNPSRMRSWRIRDTVTTNSEGHPISYHLEPMRVGHIHQGPAEEPFTNNQFYVTVNKACEKWASHNPGPFCGSNLSEYANGENLVGQDLVVWYGVTFHHLPRDEDERMMDAHWDGFQIYPRDWTATNPLDTVVLGPTATPTNTSIPAPPTSTATNTASPMPTSTATYTAVPLPPTATATASATPIPTNTPTNTPVPQGAPASATPIATATEAVAVATGAVATATDVAAATSTPSATPTATNTPLVETTNTPVPGTPATPSPTPTAVGGAVPPLTQTPMPLDLDNLTNGIFLPQIGK